METKNRKAPVAERLSDPELLVIMNDAASAGKTLDDVAAETGYSRASINQRRSEMTKDAREALLELDLTDDEIKAAINRNILPFKRGGGGAKSTRNTAAVVAAILADVVNV